MRHLAGVLVGLALLVASAPAGAAAVPPGYTYSDHWFETFDGVKLHAGVFLPSDRAPGEKHPTILRVTPYAAPNGSSGSLYGNIEGGIPEYYQELFDPKLRPGRYAIVQVDVRGFGGSGGCFEFYGPNEMRDVGVAVDWAGTQDWSTGKVGMWGISYDGAQQVLALAAKPKHLAAAVVTSPGMSAYTALWMNGIHYGPERYATSPAYTADDLVPPQNPDYITNPGYAEAAAAGPTAIPTCRADSLVKLNVIGDRSDPFWAGREAYRGAAGSSVPVLWSQGFLDAQTKPVDVELFSTMTGPHFAWFGQWSHEFPNSNHKDYGRLGYFDQAVRFLDRFVRGIDTGVVEPQVTIQEGSGKWRVEAAWPPADAEPWAMQLHPGSYTDSRGNTAGGSGAGHGSWSFTAPLAGDAHLAGEIELRVPVTTTAPGVHLVAHVYDVGPTGTAAFVTRGAMLVANAGAQEARFKVYPEDWRFVAGHRIGIVLSGADDDWFAPGVTQTSVTIGPGGTATFPLLRNARTNFVQGKSWGWVAVESFTVPQSTIDAATVGGDPPPPQTSG